MVFKKIWCAINGHRWIESERREGFYTCVHCRTRRSKEWIAAHPKEVMVR